jgi:hypothetical protein
LDSISKLENMLTFWIHSHRHKHASINCGGNYIYAHTIIIKDPNFVYATEILVAPFILLSEIVLDHSATTVKLHVLFVS